MAGLEFEWDAEKDARTRRERGFGFAFAALIFNGDVVEWPDDRQDHGEVRMRAVGLAGQAALHAVYTDRGSVRRIISARVANRQERRRWLSRG